MPKKHFTKLRARAILAICSVASLMVNVPLASAAWGLENSLTNTRPPITRAPNRSKILCVKNKTAGTECRASIAEALKDIPAGGTIVVDPSYKDKGNLVIKKPVRICVGETTTKTKTETVPIPKDKLKCLGKSDIMAGLKFKKTFKFTGKEYAKPCLTIQAPAGSNVVIRGAHIVAPDNYRYGTCVLVERGDLRLQNSIVEGKNRAISLLTSVGDSLFIENSLFARGHIGIQIFPVLNGSGSYYLSGNEIRNADIGIRIEGVAEVSAVNNTIHHNFYDGVLGLQGETFLANNLIYKNGSHGIRLTDSSDYKEAGTNEIEFSTNTFAANERRAVRADEGVDATSTVNCVFVRDKREYRKYVRASYRKTSWSGLRRISEPNKKGFREYKGEGIDGDVKIERSTPNVYWIYEWGDSPSVDSCKKKKNLRGKWKQRCIYAAQVCDGDFRPHVAIDEANKIKEEEEARAKKAAKERKAKEAEAAKAKEREEEAARAEARATDGEQNPGTEPEQPETEQPGPEPEQAETGTGTE